MKKTGIFYGSTTGTTESVARLIAEKLGVSPADVHDVSKLDAALAESYEALILGTSTWGDGELQGVFQHLVAGRLVRRHQGAEKRQPLR